MIFDRVTPVSHKQLIFISLRGAFAAKCPPFIHTHNVFNPDRDLSVIAFQS